MASGAVGDLERARLTSMSASLIPVLGGEWVAVAGFGSAVLSCRARDEFWVVA